MKIIDTTTFFEEHLMMDLRFNILDPFVDKFVVCEARFSHSGKEKEIKFNKKDYPKFEDKILHVIIDNDPVEKNFDKKANPSVLRLNSIQRIEAQRNHIAKALANEDKEDYIIYSDNDEIPNLRNFDFNTNKSKIVIFKQKLFYYKFNLFTDRILWYGTKAIKKKNLLNFETLRQIKPKKYKFYRFDTLFKKDKFINLKIIKDGGWHFTRVLSPEEIHQKELDAEHHDEYRASNKNPERIKDLIKRRMIDHDHLADTRENKYGKEFALQQLSLEKMPSYIRENQDKYKDFLDLD